MKYCIDCMFYMRIHRPAYIYRSGNLPDLHRCDKYAIGTESLITGIYRENIDCEKAREDESLCGKEGKGFILKPKPKKRFWVF